MELSAGGRLVNGSLTFAGWAALAAVLVTLACSENRVTEADAGGTGAMDGGDSGGAAGNNGTNWEHIRASWPVPNTVSSGLPNPASYDTGRAGVVVDNVTGLVWQQGIAPARKDAPGARDYCGDLSLAGYTDWRLPSRIELASLMASAPDWPSGNAAFPNTGDSFWSSSPRMSNGAEPEQGWLVNPVASRLFFDLTTALADARCVRSPPSTKEPPSHILTPDYTTLIDTGTGLEWERPLRLQGFDFKSASELCARSERRRLPSLQELATLVYELYPPPIFDTGEFRDPADGPKGTSMLPFWSSTPLLAPMNDKTNVAISFFDGQTVTALPYEGHQVRCVRWPGPK